MGICSSPCNGRISKEDYQASINDAIAFLKGGAIKSVEDMEKRMYEYSEAMEFEKAAKLRDRIKAIRNLVEMQKVV